MRALAVLAEELESRTGDADRVDALARFLRAAGRGAGALAGEWLVAGAGVRPARPARLPRAELAQAARALAAAQGTAPWLFDAGSAACDEAAEAIALLLPWPDAAPAAGGRPALADWLADWARAAALPPADRAAAIAATIAALDDAVARRWAVRAACGLVRPVVDEWQWQRAWAAAFEVDVLAVAWEWHRRRGASLQDAIGADLPRPHAFAPLAEASEAQHADLLAAWRRGELDAEPRWNGVRVHVARQGDEVAVWRRGGGLLNARLPAGWLAPAQWPLEGVIEAVLLAWKDGRPASLADARTARKGAPARAFTLHLALVEWHGAAGDPRQRRARLLARWPAPPADAVAPPPIFTTPALDRPAVADGPLAALAEAARGAGWSGLVLRRCAAPQAWVVRAAVRRVRALLQYVPGDALGAGASAALALGLVDCGFALWNRVPRSEAERHAATAAALAGEFLPPPADDPALDGLRLLPLARLPIALPADELARLHAWLRANAGLRFGAMHAVAPVLVFELGFVEARPSRRHKIGAALAGARVLRWLHDAPPGAAQPAADLFPDGGFSR
jgi:DNA ligase 1